MFQDSYGDRSPEELIKLFGLSFAQELFKLKAGSWQGPIESGYGWHLIFIDSITPRRVAAEFNGRHVCRSVGAGPLRADGRVMVRA
jgi:PPIC-type PPIASE domain